MFNVIPNKVLVDFYMHKFLSVFLKRLAERIGQEEEDGDTDADDYDMDKKRERGKKKAARCDIAYMPSSLGNCKYTIHEEDIYNIHICAINMVEIKIKSIKIAPIQLK